MGQDTLSKHVATEEAKPKWLQTEMTETGRKHVILMGHKILSYPTATARWLPKATARPQVIQSALKHR